MVNTLPPLPNPGDSDYPTDPALANAIEAERNRRKKDAKQKAKEKPVQRFQPMVDANKRSKSNAGSKVVGAAAVPAGLARASQAADNAVKSTANAYGRNPTDANRLAYENAKKKADTLSKQLGALASNAPAAVLKTNTKKPSNITGPTSAPAVDFAPGSKGNLVTGTAKSNTGAAFSEASKGIVLEGMWGDGSTSTAPQAASGTSGYGAAGTVANTGASAFVSAPILTSTTSGYLNRVNGNYSAVVNKTPVMGIGQMGVDTAKNRFLKDLTSNGEESRNIVNLMVKSGIIKNNASQQEISGAYNAAIDWASQVMASGNAKYTVIDAIKAIGKSAAAGGSGGGGGSRNQTNVSYSKKIYTEDEVRNIGNTVAQNLLGRMLSDDEIKQHLAELNTESKRNAQKTVTKTHYNASGTSSTSNSTTSGGFDAQASLDKQLGQTAESQAYTTNNLFNSAMQVLASRIG